MKKICKATSLVLVAVAVISSLFAYVFYLDLKKTFIARLSARASSQVVQQINIGDISFSLSSGINLQDVQIQNPEGFAPGQFLKIKKLSLNMNYKELFEGKLHFSSIGLYSPVLTVMKDPEGRLNISDEFKRFLSKKGSLNYYVDEIRIVSGIAEFNSDISYRGERINLVLKDLSSSPGTKTSIEGDAVLSGNNKLMVNGWADIKDEPKKFRISVSSDDFSLSPFRKILAGYKIDVEKTRIKMALNAEGDTDKGVNLTAGIQIKSPGYDFYKKKLLEIKLDSTLFYDISARSATINTLNVKAGEASVFWLKGTIKDLPEKPAYDIDAKLESLDLSLFNFMRGFKTSGILSSDVIKIKGRFDHPLPDLNGVIQIEEVSLNSDTVDVKNMNGRMIFSSANDITARIEATADILNAGGYSLSKATGVRLTLNAKGRQGNMDLSADINTSPIEMKINKEKELFLGDLNVSIEGMLKGNKFTGKSTAKSEGIRYNEYSFKKLKCGLGFNYGNDSIRIKNLKVVTDVFSSAADIVKIGMTGKKSRLLVETKNLSVSYPVKKAELQGLDFSASLNTSGKNFSGDVVFSARGGMFYKVKSGKISGSAKFNESEFSFDLPQMEFAGGRLRATAEGRTFQNPFPLKTEITAENIDLGVLSYAVEKFSGSGYRMSGNLERSRFKGTIDSKTSLHGDAAIDLKKFSFVNVKTKRYLLKDALIQSDILLQGKDCAFKADASAGSVAAKVSGAAKEFLEEKRSVSINGQLKETPATEIRNSFWDMFPDSLLYAGIDGYVSSDIKLDYRKDGVVLSGDIRLRDFMLEGENSEYAVGPVNGVVPFAYGNLGDKKKTIALSSFERSEFDAISRYYAEAFSGDDYNRITIGSLSYGFRLLKEMTLWMKQDGGVLNVARFSAKMFGGSLDGSAVVDMTDGVHYRTGMVLQGLSLAKLCEDIEPIKGYISGKANGVALLKGSGADLKKLIGRADLWTYATKDEKTKISKELLQKIGGPSIKTYLGNRNFDKGIMSFYIQKGFLIFRELEISNRNFIGVRDLSVKVAPLSNRISMDHLMWTIVEAANRGAKK